jgi:hypothetical protein
MSTRPKRLRKSIDRKIGEVDGLVMWARAPRDLDDKGQTDRVLARIATVIASVVWPHIVGKPLIHVARLRVGGKGKGNPKGFVSMSTQRIADRLAVEDASAEMAPHLAERRIPEDQPNLWTIASIADGDEVNARDRHRLFDGSVQLGRQKRHTLILVVDSPRNVSLV